MPRTRPGATRRPMSAGDRARPAPEVEHAGGGCEVRGKVSGRVVDRTPLVRPQYALVVTVRVGHWFPQFAGWRWPPLEDQAVAVVLTSSIVKSPCAGND